MMVSRNRRLGGWWGAPLLFVAPAMLMYALFVAGPAVSALYVSLCKWTGFTPRMEYTGLGNFRALWHDQRFREALANNLWMMSVGGVFFFFFALVFAAALNSKYLRARKFFQTMIFFPSFVSAVGTAIFWKLLMDSKGGLFNLALRGIGLEGVDWLSPPNATNSVLAMMIWAGVGGTMILLLAGMRRIPKDYYEAASIDGASGPQQFVHITLPMMREVLVIALSLWMIGSMKIFGAVQAMLAPDINDKNQVVATLQYDMAFNNRDGIFLMGRATAIAVVQVAIVLVLVGLVRLLREKKSLEY